MKHLIYLLVPAMLLASCGGNKTADKQAPGKPDSTTAKVTPVSVITMQPTDFKAYVEVQSSIAGDENVLAVPQAQGTVKNILVHAGDRVSRGEVLATLDASLVDQQMAALMPQLTLTKSIYEKQQNLWAQNIGTEVQLMTAKANYEGVQKQIDAYKTQRDFYRIVSPISGTVDAVNIKIGDFASPAGAAQGQGIKVVSYDKLKAEATIGENYLGKVKVGDQVTLILPDINDTIKTKLSYVSQAVDPVSRAFTAQVRLDNNTSLHPNMACIMRIVNYENPKAFVVPVSAIQKTSQGAMLYTVEGNKAKTAYVTTGHNANGQVEILSGLKTGDQVVVRGYQELDNGQQVTIE